MEHGKETIRLNGLSRAIIAATVALGLGVVICAGPAEVSALSRAKAPAVTKTLSDTPGISLTRAFGADDEDCISVANNRGGAVKFVCAQ